MLLSHLYSFIKFIIIYLFLQTFNFCFLIFLTFLLLLFSLYLSFSLCLSFSLYHYIFNINSKLKSFFWHCASFQSCTRTGFVGWCVQEAFLCDFRHFLCKILLSIKKIFLNFAIFFY